MLRLKLIITLISLTVDDVPVVITTITIAASSSEFLIITIIIIIVIVIAKVLKNLISPIPTKIKREVFL
jgi:hypothetical protein